MHVYDKNVSGCAIEKGDLLREAAIANMLIKTKLSDKSIKNIGNTI